MNTYRANAIVAAAALLVTTFAGAAVAQTDHLKCYKIKDVGTFKSATADLVPSRPQFPGENCTLKGKAATLCVPAEKTNVSMGVNDFPSQTLQDALLCYKVKCPSKDTYQVPINDQFAPGARTVQRGKAMKVCGPAFEQ